MLRQYSGYFCTGIVLFMLFHFLCAAYAYGVNLRRSNTDSQKKVFHVGALLLAPFTWILFGLAAVTIVILRAVAYMLFLVLFTVAVLAIRKPFLFAWLDKTATKIGNKLLEANTLLIRSFFGKQA